MDVERRMGMEQEFFVVSPDGEPANRVDELLEVCHRHAAERDIDRSCFGAEWVKGIIELATPPCGSVEQLAANYIGTLKCAIQAAEELELRLYPLAVYPLHLIPVIRDEMRYHTQVRTVGHERFLNAGRCTGTHLHLEVPPGTIDEGVAVGYRASAESQQELLNVYNLATALDPVLIALSRACPFYEAVASGLAYRTVQYRGAKSYGWEGVYSELPQVGALRPYGRTIEELVSLQFERHYSWLSAMEAAKVERELFPPSGAGLLNSSWNPVRLNPHGTVELRNMDSNLPRVILELVAIIARAHRRVIEESLHVEPQAGVHTFKCSAGRLLVPDFKYLSHELLFAAVTEGLENPRVQGFANSVVDFAREESTAQGSWLLQLEPTLVDAELGRFQTTESQILKQFPPSGERLTRDEGLSIVRYACEELQTQVQHLEMLATSSPTASS